MIKKTPLVSVLMPSYNHSNYVKKAIESVFQQSYSNIELIIIDDGSTDDSIALIESVILGNEFHIKFISRGNKGLSNTLNECLSLASGEYITALASDDYLHSDFVKTNVEQFELLDKNYGLIHSNAIKVDEKGKVITNYKSNKVPSGDVFNKLINGRYPVVASTIFYKKSLATLVGGFDPLLVQEDYDFQLRMARICSFYHIDKPLFFSREVEGSLGRSPKLWIDDIENALAKHQDYIEDYDDLILELHLRKSKILFNGMEYNLGFAELINYINSKPFSLEKYSAVISSLSIAIKVFLKKIYGVLWKR